MSSAHLPQRRRSLQGRPPILTMLLAGGAGSRMLPLTREHSKPMIPFGAIYRLIDIPLSNCINSGLRKIYILTQDKALSLNRHVRHTWNILSAELDEFIELLPPTKRIRETWYLGTADAIYQNIQSIEEEGLPYVLILSADHVYKMNYEHMLHWHIGHDADATVATTLIPPSEAGRFGIVRAGADSEISGFEEKPQHDQPHRSHFNPNACSASMGIYLFSTPVLLDALRRDAENAQSAHDFGKDILPKLIGRGRVSAYDFVDENRKDVRDWRDVGTLESYWEANMDLVAVNPVFNLYDDEWPIRGASLPYPPAKFVFAQEGRRMGVALDSLISHGCIISGGKVIRSVLSPGARVDSFSEVESSILLANSRVGRYSHVRRAIVEAGVHVPENSEIGIDPDADRRAGHHVTPSGLVVVSKPALGSVPKRDPEAGIALKTNVSGR
jgi:glucose-1-phosphate adenylyltransferase